jgi:Ca2+-binding RTX toxin-like protein
LFAAGPVTADLNNPANNTGEAAGDSYVSIEGLAGTRFNDVLRGNADSNILNGGPGADVLDGGPGSDMASYLFSARNVIADLADPGNNTNDAVGDTYISIENLRGSDFDDTLRGDDGNNLLEGRGGADVLDGRGGTDTASYQNATAGLTVDLATPANNTGEALGDTYISIENVRGSAFADTLRGDSGNNQSEGRGGADVLDGRAGTDTASYQNATAGLTVDLATPANNTGEALGDTYISIENLRGSAFADILRGDSNNNLLNGGDGADVLDGDGGSDTAGYQNATAGLTVDLATPANNTGEAVGDTYISIENLRGSAFADILRGDSNNNLLNGGDGADVLDGGKGSDTASYQNATAGVTADLATPANNAGEALGDTYISIENLRGSAFADTLRGDKGDNLLNGGDGADVLDGGKGSDTASYQNATAGVTADLATFANNTGEALGDTYISIENLRGSEFDDILRGDSNDNVLDGGGGADVIEGGVGTDTLIGGDGLDTASYEHATGAVKVNLATTSAQNTSGAGRDTLSGFENLTGSEFGDQLTGSSDANAIMGLDGDDVLNGGIGADSLTGGTGADRFVYTALSDSNSVDGVDQINDFDAADVIDVSAIDADTSTKKDQAFAFAGENSGVVANSITWHEDGGNTIVQMDVDGNLTNGAEMEVVLIGTSLNLTASDFIL